jgi:DNA polymerase-3 subunit chi
MEVKFKVIQSELLSDNLDMIVENIISMYDSCIRVGVLAPTTIANTLDEMLWQDGQESFIPHFCATNIRDYSSYKNIPILITDNMFIMSQFKTIINLCDVPIDSSKVPVENIIEMVFQNEKALQISRKKYVYYKKVGADISTDKTAS